MRVPRKFLLAALVLARVVAPADAAPPPDRQSSGAPGDSDLPRLVEFLDWAHPHGGCGPPTGVRIAGRWPGGLTARYEIVCDGATRALQGVFGTRASDKVWQVTSGFEADADRIAAALANLQGVSHAGRGPTGGLEPPPGDPETRTSDNPLDLVPAPKPTAEIVPEYPEEAGRARLIGDAHVTLLTEISPEGAPLRARPLRGPDPDLGMRGAATDAVMRSRFSPARLGGRPLTYFAPIELTFAGLPPESRNWEHRALFHVAAIVSSDADIVDDAFRRLQAGESFEAILRAPASGATAGEPGASPMRGGDWGFVSAATLPAPVRKALHEARVGACAGPVTAEGLHYLLQKQGEIYYALRPHDASGGDLSYQVLHQRNAPQGEALRHALESDIADYLAERRREAYVNEAARLMGIHQLQVQVGQLLIHTDVLDEGEVKVLGQVVEAAVQAHERFWAPLVPLRPFNREVLVYAWARQADHDRLHRLWQTGKARVAAGQAGAPREVRPTAEPWSYAGEYIPASRVLSVPCEPMGGHLPIPMIIHEAIHMLDYERAYRPGGQASQWFQEGLATYFSFSQMGGRMNIEPGEIRRSRTVVSGQVRLQFDPRVPLLEYIKRIRDEGAIPLRDLLAARAGDPLWSGDRAVLAYSASWTLVHFLMHGGRGRYRATFGEYARLEAQGQGGVEAFTRLFGQDLRPLEQAWHDDEENL